MVRILLIMFLFCLNVTSKANAIELVASLDRNPINADESVTLMITANGDIDNEQPDFSALNNDFRFNTPSVSRSTQIINGVRSSSVTWRINLIPKRAGTFIIPKFSLLGTESNSIGLRVMPAGTASGEPREFYLSTEINADEIFLQQQLVYTVKIFIAGDIQSGSLSEPELAGAIIEKLGEDKEYEELIDGVRYRIIERKFAVIPQSSGQFTINSPVFEARVISRLGQNFAYFNRTKTITRIGPEKTITVKPIPNDYQFTWLPSEQVVLEEEWQGNTDSLVAGEPATRTITLTALGLTEEQLPDIEAVYHPSFKTYPEQPQRATVQRDNRLISQSVLNTAIIAEQAGQFVLPEITVPWFNVNTGQTEFATIPARSISVVQGNTPTAPQPQTIPENQVKEQNDEFAQDETQIVRDQEDAALFDWLHLVLLVLVFILAGALATVVFRKHQNPAPSQPPALTNDDEDIAWKRLAYTIEQGQLNNLPKVFSGWASIIFNKPQITVQHALTLMDNKDITNSYNAMMSTRYSTNSIDIDQRDFINKLAIQRKTLQSPTDSGLPSLYPSAIS